MSDVKIYGFGLIKNGVKFDYPFMESLRSMAPLVEKIYFNVGDCEDNTLEKIKLLNKELNEKITILEKPWPSREFGHVLSEMTNYSLERLREKHNEENAWAIYLQSDEVLSERDYTQIKEDINKAQKLNFDTVRFRYLHFWQSHFEIAIMKRWYPQEIRAIKIKSNIKSWGDAQGFKNYTKTFESDCHIYHYGHIRNESAYVDKMTEFFKLYYSGMRLKRKTWQYFIRSFDREKTLKYFGHHPEVMRKRIERIESKYQNTYPLKDGVNIIGYLPKDISSKVLARDVNQTVNFKERNKSYNTIIINPSNLQKIFNPSKVKEKSESPLCRPLSKDFIIILKLSERGIWTN
jgi:hypothetical protein